MITRSSIAKDTPPEKNSYQQYGYCLSETEIGPDRWLMAFPREIHTLVFDSFQLSRQLDQTDMASIAFPFLALTIEVNSVWSCAKHLMLPHTKSLPLTHKTWIWWMEQSVGEELVGWLHSKRVAFNPFTACQRVIPQISSFYCLNMKSQIASLLHVQHHTPERPVHVSWTADQELFHPIQKMGLQ